MKSRTGGKENAVVSSCREERIDAILSSGAIGSWDAERAGDGAREGCADADAETIDEDDVSQRCARKLSRTFAAALPESAPSRARLALSGEV